MAKNLFMLPSDYLEWAIKKTVQHKLNGSIYNLHYGLAKNPSAASAV